MLRAIAAIALAVLLTACGIVGNAPNGQWVKRAIALQLSQTQSELSQQLRLATQPDVEIKRLKITARSPLQIQELEAFQVKGLCDFAVKGPSRTLTQRNIPFEVVLQRQVEGKTWRLAYLRTDANGDPFWATQRIPTDEF